MKDSIKLTTSPLIFICSDKRNGLLFDGVNHIYYSDVSSLAFEILFFYLNPNFINSGIDYGFEITHINELFEIGLLLDVNSEDYKNAYNWEKHKWSRAGFLTFSQQNIRYIEDNDDFSKFNDIIQHRRNTISKYSAITPYPKSILQDSNDIINLETPVTLLNFEFNKLAKRACIRQFSTVEMKYSVFSSILFYSSSNIRIAENSKKTDDEFYLLNSFYSWLNIYILIQGVENIPRGIYQYNPINHSLRLIQKDCKNSQISKSVQGQYWIGGGGFCVYFISHWERYMWLYRHSRAYINLLIQLGEICQEFLTTATLLDVGGWMTPAIHESYTSAFLKLSDNQDAMYFLKLGKAK